MTRPSFLSPIRDRILRAYASAIPEREPVIAEIDSRLQGIDVGHRQESFYSIPTYSVVNAGWWAVEAIWCLSYCVAVWGDAFKTAMECRCAEVPLHDTAKSYIGKGLFNLAIDTLSACEQQPWLHENVPDYPYDAFGAPFDDTINATEAVFLNAIGWILLHEVAHIHHRHGTSRDVVAEEREADETATRWLFDDAPFGTVDDRFSGVATAMFYMWIREDRMAVADHDHPPVSDRLEACIANARIIGNAWCLCVLAGMMEAYEQATRPGSRLGSLSGYDTCRDYVDACLQSRRAASVR